MATDAVTGNWPNRWASVEPFLRRTGPFAQAEFEANDEAMDFMQENIKVLVIGAGGLGCELLKDLALLGFRHIDVIDMDTIDLSNLNRQFLFRKEDIGKPKANVAAAFINKRIAGANVTPHHKTIQEFDEAFYRGFSMVVCGLDSILARRWINSMLYNLLEYEEDGSVDTNSIIPMVDGGTEGFKGNARIVLSSITPCIECTLDLYPPQVNFPMCTIAHTPRLPEHCIEYARILLWPQEKPFGEEKAIDGDDPAHLQWLYEKSVERANEYNISGVTYRLTQGVIKRIIPAVASTNAVIAAACATEVFKTITFCNNKLNNYMNFNDTEGVYTYTFEGEKKEDCAVCSTVPQKLNFTEDTKLQDVIDYLKESAQYQMKNPAISTTINGKHRMLYMSHVKSIEEKTKANLKKTLTELELTDGHEINVADPTSPNSLTFRLQIASNMEKD